MANRVASRRTSIPRRSMLHAFAHASAATGDVDRAAVSVRQLLKMDPQDRIGARALTKEIGIDLEDAAPPPRDGGRWWQPPGPYWKQAIDRPKVCELRMFGDGLYGPLWATLIISMPVEKFFQASTIYFGEAALLIRFSDILWLPMTL